ncbi:MAG TPA: InlB B-repeat-containing protein [Methanocorpusculum sp.]|nr:InlB B-repeat-containing protein [Methanocorpusculum sp.]
MTRNLDENELGPPFRAAMLSFLIIFVFVLSVMPVSADTWIDYIGDDAFTSDNITVTGTQGSYIFTIRSPCGLAWAAKDINSNKNRTCTFELGSDINLAGYDWVPIGNDGEHKFLGTFDGKGHTISNLKIDNSTGDYQGLFGVVGYIQSDVGHHANITNVTLTNVSITGKIYVGGLVGLYSNLGSNCYITNCSVTGKVSGNSRIGGLIGYAELRNPGTTTISNSYASGVSINGIGSGKDYSGYGGLIGYMLLSNNTSTNITNCYAENADVNGISSVGGLIGYMQLNTNQSSTTISNCYASGKVNGSSYVGGLIGWNYITNNKANIYTTKTIIINSNSSCNVTGSTIVGGLVGYTYSAGNVKSDILNSYATGEVSGTERIGGLVGGNQGSGINSEINITSCYAAGNVSGSEWKIGGLVGDQAATSGSKVIITDCYAIGDVNGGKCVGGLSGMFFSWGSSGISGIAAIEKCYATGKVNGTERVGGLVGGRWYDSCRNNTYVNNSAALNKELSGTSNVGRIIGHISGSGGVETTLTNNYAWEGMKNKDGQTFPSDDPKNGKNAASYEVWANETFYKDVLQWTLDDKWKIDPDNGNIYPLPYIKAIGSDGLLRDNVIHLKPLLLTFDQNGGTGTMYKQGFKAGLYKKLTPNAFVKTGHTFEGWSDTQDGDISYEDEQIITISTDKTIYSVWKANVTNITLNNSSAETPTYVVNITYNSNSFNKTLQPPSYEGYGFKGYNNSSSGGVQVINAELKLNKGVSGYTDASGNWTNDTRNIELWAVWENNPSNLVNITFKANGGVGEDVNQTVVKDQSTALINPNFKRTGYILAGWNNSSPSGGYEIDINVTDTIKINEDTQLWAVWEKLYDINLIQTEGGKISASQLSAVSGSEITLTAAPEYDYAFAGWTVKDDTHSPVAVDANGKFVMPECNVVVTAKFTYIKQYDTGEEVEDEEHTPIVTPTQNQTVTPTAGQSESAIIEGTEASFNKNKVVVSVKVPEGSSGNIIYIPKKDMGIWIPESIDEVYEFDLSIDGTLKAGDVYINFVIYDYVLDNLGLKPNDVGLRHFENEVWNELETTFTKKDDRYIYSALTQSLSPFEVFFKEGAAKPVEEKPTAEPTQSPMPVLGLLAGLCVTVLLFRRK